MSTTKTTTKTPVSTTAVAEKTEIVDTIADLYSNGVERLAEVQKRGIDLAVKQNAELLDAWKKIAQTVPGAPGLFMLDLASNAFSRYADTQKGAIDLVIEQSQALAGLLKERAALAVSTFEHASTLVKHTVEQTVDQSVAAQKKALDYSAARTRLAFQGAKDQFGLAGTPAQAASESFQRGVENLIESQKELLDIAARPFAPVN